MKSKFKWLGILFAFALCFGIFGGANASLAFAATEYNVTYNHLDSSTEVLSTVDGYAQRPTEAAPAGYKTNWYYYVDGSNMDIFDFSKQLESDITLYAQQVRCYNVNYYKYTDISNGLDSTDYTLDTTLAIVANSYATSIEAEQETGYNFLYWTADYNTKAKFVFDETQITQDTNLYPVYAIKTYTLNYYVDDAVYLTQTIDHNERATLPTAPQKDGYTFDGWYILDNQSNTAFDFNTQIAQDYDLVAKFTSNSYSVVYTTNAYLTFAGNASVVDGNDLVINITINNSYNQTQLTLDHIVITGDYDDAEIEKAASNYILRIYEVKSDLTLNVVPLAINKYTVTLPTVTGLELTVITNPANYTYSDGVYTLDYGKVFEFSVTVLEGYFAKVLSFSGVYSSSTKYTLSSNSSNTVVTSNCQVVEYVLIQMQNTQNVSYAFSTAILEQDVDNIKIERGTSSTFTVQANEGYFLKGVTGANKIGNNYVFTANYSQAISFDAVEYHVVTLPAVAGVAGYIVSGHLEGSGYTYYVEDGADITVTVQLLSQYSDSSSVLEATGANNVVAGANANVFTIQGVTADSVVTVSNVGLNNLAITFNQNATYGEFTADNNTVVYGGDYEFTFTLAQPYSQTTLSSSDFEIVGDYVDIQVDGNTITVINVTSPITVSVVDLVLNIYGVNITNNTYGNLTASVMSVTHGGNITISAELTTKYNQTTLAFKYLDVIGQYETYVENNGQVTFVGVRSNFALELKDLPVNSYQITFPAAPNGEFTIDKPGQKVQHGTNLTFTITLNAAYTQNIDTFTLYVNSEELIGVKNGNSISYNLQNITEEKTMATSAIVINSYVVSYKDGNIVLFIRNENYNAAPTQPSDPIKPGYIFDGWFLNEALTMPFDFENYTISNDISVYAKFIVEEYTISFEIEGHIVAQVGARYGESISDKLPTIPSKVGHQKVAPYWDFASAAVDKTFITKNATINAVYTIDVYRITFMGLGKVIETQYVEYFGDAVAPTNTTITGYVFEGWDNVFTQVTEDVVVNAIYQIITYKVYFVDVNAGTVIYNQFVDYNFCADRPNDDYVLSDRVGYTVYGWYRDNQFVNMFDFSTKITQDTYVYGKIDVSVFDINFMVDGQLLYYYSLTYGQSLTEIPSIPSKVGYTAVAPVWSVNDFSYVTSDIECEAIYTINRYVVTFVYPDGTTFEQTVNHGETIKNLPNKNLRFGQRVSADSKQLANITENMTIKLKVQDFLPLILVAIAVVFGGLITLLVIFAIKIKRGRANMASSKEVKNLQQKVDQRQAYIDRMNDKK